MSHENEVNYAKQMAKVYNWLKEYADEHDWFAFRTAVRKGEYIFPGRGRGRLPNGDFYSDIFIAPSNDEHVCSQLIFSSNNNWRNITRIFYHTIWGHNDDFIALAQNMGLDTNSTRGTDITIAENNNDDNLMRNELYDWLTNNQDAFANFPKQYRAQRFARHEHSEKIRELIADGFIVINNGNNQLEVNENKHYKRESQPSHN